MLNNINTINNSGGTEQSSDDASNIDLIAKAYELGEQSIIDFRKLFLPSDDDVPSAWFHHEWDKVLRTGQRHYAVEAFRESAKSQIVKFV